MAELVTVSGDVLLLDEEDVPLFAGKRLYTLRTRNLTYVTYVGMANGKQRSILAHRVIMRAEPGAKVDHRDGNGLNCRKENLRFATTSQNGANRGVQQNNKAGYKGVFFQPARHTSPDCWIARITVDGEHRHIGSFKTDVEAARAYDAAAVQTWGEYARVNFPGEPLVDLKQIARGRRGASRFRGVSWDARHEKWLVRVNAGGKTTCPGRFADEEDAARVYDMVAFKAGVAVSKFNFPDAGSPEAVAAAEAILERTKLLARGGTSFYRGVSWYTAGNCWRGSIQVDRKQKILGNFSTREEAAHAYDRAALAAWGEAARPWLNFPVGDSA